MNNTLLEDANAEIVLLHTARNDGKRCLATMLHPPQRISKSGKIPEVRKEVTRSAVIFLLILLPCLVWLISVFYALPDPRTLASQAERDADSVLLKVPRSFQELRQVKETLDLYQDHFFINVVVLYTSLYLFMQTFMVPGCFFLNLLVGAIVPVLPGMLFITVLTTLGCTFNFLLSKHVLAGAVTGLFPERIQDFQRLMTAHRGHMFYYLLFLRIMPLLPAWVVNLASPLARVPLWEFMTTTAIGFQPQFFSFIKAGQVLGTLHSWRDLYSWETTVTIGLCGVLCLLPIIVRPYLPESWTGRPACSGMSGNELDDLPSVVPPVNSDKILRV